MIVGTIGGYDAKILNTFTSAKNLVICRRPLVMPNPRGGDGNWETLSKNNDPHTVETVSRTHLFTDSTIKFLFVL